MHACAHLWCMNVRRMSAMCVGRAGTHELQDLRVVRVGRFHERRAVKIGRRVGKSMRGLLGNDRDDWGTKNTVCVREGG